VSYIVVSMFTPRDDIMRWQVLMPPVSLIPHLENRSLQYRKSAILLQIRRYEMFCGDTDGLLAGRGYQVGGAGAPPE